MTGLPAIVRAVAHLLGPRAVAERAQVVRAEPAVAAEFLRRLRAEVICGR